MTIVPLLIYFRLIKKLNPLAEILRIYPVIGLLALSIGLKAQKVDSIFFNLYTDSLKKGTHNYINVDGKLSNGRWMPLTGNEIIFTSTAGKFDNNSLILDKDFKEEKVKIKAMLRADTTICRYITIYIKKTEDNEKLKTEEQILKELEEQGKQKSKKSKGYKSRWYQRLFA